MLLSIAGYIDYQFQLMKPIQCQQVNSLGKIIPSDGLGTAISVIIRTHYA